MRRTPIAAAVVAAAMIVVATSASAADETRSTQTDIAVCPKVTHTLYPVPPGEGPATFGCGPSVFTGPGDLGAFGTADSPLGVFVHVQAVSVQTEGVPGPVTVTIAGGSRTLSASGTTSKQGTIILPVGALGPGTYSVTAVFAGSSTGSTITYEPSQASGTFMSTAGH